MSKKSTNSTLAKNRKKMDLFLDKLRNSGNVRLACQAAGVSRRTIYNWRNKWITFAEDWDEAIEEACDVLEGHAWKRATKGQSDRLLMFLLKAYRKEKFSDRREITGVNNEPVQFIINRKNDKKED